MLDNHDISNVLLIGFDESTQKLVYDGVKNGLKNQKSSLNIVCLKDDYDIINENLIHGNFYGVIFIDSNISSMPIDSICRKINSELSGSIILVTDDTSDLCHEFFSSGISCILRRESINNNNVKDSIFSARNNFEMQIKLKIAEKRFADIVSSSSDWLWEIDLDLNFVYFNVGDANRSLYGIHHGKKFYETFLLEEQEKIKKFFTQLIRKPEEFRNEEFWGRDLTGKICWSISGVPVYDLKGNFVGFRGISRNISSEKYSEGKVDWLGNHDPITGLFNQARFYSEISNSLIDIKRLERTGVLAIIDIDQFKLINSHYNNEAGDRYLRHLADIIKKVSSKKDIISRLSSDKFGLMMPSIDFEKGFEILSKLVETVSKTPLEFNGKSILATISVGMVNIPEHGLTTPELIRRAEVANTRAKERGRSRVHLFNPEEYNDSVIAKNLEMIDFISESLRDDRVAIYYQPIVLLSDTRNIARYEVLMRMYDKQGNIVPPAQLIKAAEEFGMNAKIDTVIATKAISQAKEWYHEDGKEVVLAINLSGFSFDDDELIRNLCNMLEEAKLPKGSITFEITETAALRDLSSAQRAIADLKEKGASFALDDFGTGYASFQYVKNLDVDYIKIDGSFIRNLTRSSEDHVFVRALYNIAKEMKVKTIAEMVEDLPTVELLKDMGIDYAQGYYFGKPKPYIIE